MSKQLPDVTSGELIRLPSQVKPSERGIASIYRQQGLRLDDIAYADYTELAEQFASLVLVFSSGGEVTFRGDIARIIWGMIEMHTDVLVIPTDGYISRRAVRTPPEPPPFHHTSINQPEESS